MEIVVFLIGVGAVIGLVLLLSQDNTSSGTGGGYIPQEQENPLKRCEKCSSKNIRWARACQDGTPDLRFSENHIICKDCKHVRRIRVK